jgi:hypothetical protein
VIGSLDFSTYVVKEFRYTSRCNPGPKAVYFDIENHEKTLVDVAMKA